MFRCVVISGYPKTGTTFLSHVAENATGKPYIEGSMKFAWSPSVIHTHSRWVPKSSVFSFRPIEKVMASFITHRILEIDPSFAERANNHMTTDDDVYLVRGIGNGLLDGSWRLPAPSDYYAAVVRRGATIVNILDLSDPSSSSFRRLQNSWKLTQDVLSDAIRRAERLAQDRRADGDEFYNRPSSQVRDIMKTDLELSGLVNEEASRTRAVIEGMRRV
jgi:hypothetical protein